VKKTGWTPTGRVLREVLDEQLDRLDNAQRNGSYSSERPLEIIVLTDGVPSETFSLLFQCFLVSKLFQ
jgi:hypothetical protein